VVDGGEKGLEKGKYLEGLFGFSTVTKDELEPDV